MLNKKRKYSIVDIFFVVIMMVKFCYADTKIYQFVDQKGNTVVSNNQAFGSHVMDLPPLTVLPVSQMQNNSNNFTRKEQKRRLILQEERVKEQQSLKDEQSLLSQEQKLNRGANTQKVYQLQDTISEHQKNINLLNKQLGN